jgi:hypothetical protein
MLELGEHLRVGEAQANRRASGAGDLPEAALGLRQRRRTRGGDQAGSGKEGRARGQQARIPVHELHLTTNFVTV